MSHNRPARRGLRELRESLAAWPAGLPSDAWDDESLLAYIAHVDGQLAALEPVDQFQALEVLSDQELEALAAATSREEAQALIEQRIVTGQQPSRLRKKVVKVIK